MYIYLIFLLFLIVYCSFDFIMDRSKIRKVLGSEEEEGCIFFLFDEDL